eukprot:scaffold37083_cov36-Tisochrysis_lutea.AAC.1
MAGVFAVLAAQRTAYTHPSGWTSGKVYSLGKEPLKDGATTSAHKIPSAMKCIGMRHRPIH